LNKATSSLKNGATLIHKKKKEVKEYKKLTAHKLLDIVIALFRQ
jgi:hypothetical protein